MNLPKNAAELLSSRLKEKIHLDKDIKISYFQTRREEFCTRANGLLKRLGIQTYVPVDWRLFVDSSKRSLKCVLLHNGNQYASGPLTHSTTMKENYEEIKAVLEKISYYEHSWVICMDLKMVNFFTWTAIGLYEIPMFYLLVW